MISSNSGPISRLPSGTPENQLIRARTPSCQTAKTLDLTESEELNTDSFPLDRLEFKAIITSLIGI